MDWPILMIPPPGTIINGAETEGRKGKEKRVCLADPSFGGRKELVPGYIADSGKIRGCQRSGRLARSFQLIKGRKNSKAATFRDGS
jgi:hypothetical protein